MKYAKKFRVVPYVSNSLQKPSENYIEALDNKMKNIIANKTLPDDYKVKLYHQNLNKFLLKYDPESYGVAPSITKLIKIVGDYIEKKNNIELIDKDLAHVFKVENIKKEDELGESEIKNEPQKKLNFNSPGEDSLADEYNFNENFYKLNPSVSYLNNNENSYINKSDLNDSIFETNTKPAANTRSQNIASHPEGIDYSKKQKKKTNSESLENLDFKGFEQYKDKSTKTLRTPGLKGILKKDKEEKKSPFLNLKENKSNKYKNTQDSKKASRTINAKSGKESNEQSGGHFLWSSWIN